MIAQIPPPRVRQGSEGAVNKTIRDINGEDPAIFVVVLFGGEGKGEKRIEAEVQQTSGNPVMLHRCENLKAGQAPPFAMPVKIPFSGLVKNLTLKPT